MGGTQRTGRASRADPNALGVLWDAESEVVLTFEIGWENRAETFGAGRGALPPQTLCSV